MEISSFNATVDDEEHDASIPRGTIAANRHYDRFLQPATRPEDHSRTSETRRDCTTTPGSNSYTRHERWLAERRAKKDSAGKAHQGDRERSARAVSIESTPSPIPTRRDTISNTIKRKRSTYDMQNAPVPSKRVAPKAARGLFVRNSDSDDEDNLFISGEPVRKGSRKASGFRDYRRSQDQQSQFLADASVMMHDQVDMDQCLSQQTIATSNTSKFMKQSHEVERNYAQGCAAAEAAFRQSKSTRDSEAYYPCGPSSRIEKDACNTLVNEERQHQLMTADVVEGPQQTRAPARTFMPNQDSKQPMQHYVEKTPLTPPEAVERRFVRATPKVKKTPPTMHQQFLKRTSKVLSNSARHSGEIGITNSTTRPKVEESRLACKDITTLRSPSLHIQPLPQPQPDIPVTTCEHIAEPKVKSQAARTLSPTPTSSKASTPTPGKAITPAPTQATASSPAAIISKAIICAQESAAQFHDSLVAENDRHLVDWRNSGMDWETIAVQWKLKTGLQNAQKTLETKYRQAKKYLELELHGMEIAQQRALTSNPSYGSRDIVGTIDDQHGHTDDTQHLKIPSRPDVERPTVGGKNLSNKVYMARMAEIKEIQEEEAQLEYEQTNCFFRNQSPQPDDEKEPLYFVYRVLRRQWSSPEEGDIETLGQWYTPESLAPQYHSLIEANQAALQESARTRFRIGPTMRFKDYQGKQDENDMYRWIMNGQDGAGYEVKVERELCAVGQGYTQPESKLGWFRKSVFGVFRRVEIPAQQASVAGEEDLPTKGAPISIAKVEEGQIGNFCMVADLANRNAANALLDLALPKKPNYTRIEERKEYEHQLEQQNAANEAGGKLFDTEFETDGGSKGRVWVEQRYLEGPLNV